MKATISAALALATVASVAALPQAPTPPPRPSQVSAQGCVEPGVEERCLVVKDLKSGILYNLLFKGARPAIGIGIDFTGVLFDGMTYCMQGTPVQVTAWTRNDSLKCSLVQTPSQ
jgi:hypothetical protein